VNASARPTVGAFTFLANVKPVERGCELERLLTGRAERAARYFTYGDF
jgi:hypothetical protein